MLDVLKEKLETQIKEWQAEIDSNSNKSTTIDASVVFEKLFCRSIVHICFGEDVSDMEFDLDVRVSANSTEFVRKKLKMAEGIHEFEEQMLGLIIWKWLNPVY